MNILISVFCLVTCAHGALAQSIWQKCPIPVNATVTSIQYSEPAPPQPASGHLCIGTSSGVYMSLDLGVNWFDLSKNLPDKNVVALAASSAKYLTAATDSGLFLSQVGGQWTRSADRQIQSMVNGISLDYERRLYAATRAGLYFSLDHGDHWLILGLDTLNVLSSLASPSGVVYAGLAIDAPGGILRTIDFGSTWESVFDDPVNIQALTMGFDNRIIAGTYSHNPFDPSVRRSTSMDTAWVGSGLINCAVGSFAWGEGRNLYAGIQLRNYWPGTITFKGVQLSTDAGETWSDFNEGLTDLDVYSLLYLDGHLFAGTASGLFKRDLQPASDIRRPIDVPLTLSLYPQPVTSGLQVSFAAPLRWNGKIEIVNALGVIVFSTDAQRGTTRFDWDAGQSPNGLYLLRVLAPGQVVEKRFVVLK